MKTFQSILFVFVCAFAVSCTNSGKKSEASGEEVAATPVEDAKEVVADDRGYIVAVGDQVPEFNIEYTDGRSVKISDLKGKLVMIQFTASWCAVCRKEMPYIESEIWQKHQDNPNFELIGITLKEDKETTVKFAEAMKVTYPLTLDTDGEKFALFTAPKAGVTRNIIVDKEGRILMLTRLFDREEFTEMVGFIDGYLADNF